MRLLIIGGSDAGISAALRAREVDSTVAKRIDIFAAALLHNMQVEDMNDLDLSYTPPLGTPWDAVQLSAQAWSKQVS